MWTDAQNAHTREFLDGRPKLDAIRTDVTEILAAKTVGYRALQARGNRYFCMKSEPPRQQPPQLEHL